MPFREENSHWAQEILTLRLSFLKLGPDVKNLELNFTQLTTVFLNHNKFAHVDDDAFALCQNLKFLAIQDNQISQWFDLSYLSKLEFVDLCNNKIDHHKVECLPECLLVLKLQGNPLCQASDASAHRWSYRKVYVEALANLDQIDKVEVLQAERLSYKGLLPRMNLKTLLQDQETKVMQ